MELKAYCAITFLVAALSVFIGLFVISNNYRKPQNIVWFFLCLVIAGWNFGYAMTMIPSIPYDIALLSSRLSHASGIIISPLFFAFTLIFLKILKEKKYELIVSFVVSLSLAVLCLTNFVVPNLVPKMFMQLYPVGGIGYVIYIANFLFWVLYSHYLYLLRFKNLSGFEREQVRFFLLGTILGFLGGSNCFPLIFGAPISPVLSVLIIIFPFSTVYAITRYRLMDIRVIIKKGLVYAIVTGIISALYISIISGAEMAYKNMPYYNVLWLTIPSLILLAIIFAPLIDFVQNAVEKTVFKKQYLANQVAVKFSEGIKELMDINELSKYITRSAIKVFKLKGAALFIVNEKTHNYECRDARGDLARFKDSIFAADDPRARYIKNIKTTLVAEELPEGEVLNRMKEDGISVCVPSISVKNENALIGFLLGAERGEAQIFSDEDIYLLDSFGSQSSLSIENALMYRAQIDEIERTMSTSRMSDLGAAAAGVAHEAKNALVSIYAVSQMLAEKKDDPAFLEKTKNMVSSEVERMRILMEGVINYSDPVPLNIRSEKLKDLLGETAVLVRDIAKGKGIAIEISVDEGPYVKADKNTMKQVFLNLFLNAIEAIGKDGKITVSCAGAPDGKVNIFFKDTGPGIPAGKLKKILEPFFTTKQQGTGLGLAIVKKSVESNGGSLRVESSGKAGEGATFIIALNAG